MKRSQAKIISRKVINIFETVDLIIFNQKIINRGLHSHCSFNQLISFLKLIHHKRSMIMIIIPVNILAEFQVW
jgi:hypothetical protein